MKKIIGYSILMFFMALASSCEDEDFTYPEGQVGRSKITTYANITITGPQYLSLVKGGTYDEQGATATEGTAELQVQVSGQVDVNTPGVYVISYSAVNKDGFPASSNRYIAVLPSAEQPGVSIAGAYAYAPAPGTEAQITKLAPGFYQTSNLWSAATTIPAFIISLNGTDLTLPLQTTGFGRLQGTGILDRSAGTLNYTVDLLDQGIDGSTRRWLIK